MRVYIDSSALLKRVFAEDESVGLQKLLREHARDGEALIASSLAWVEVARAVRVYAERVPKADADPLVEVALSGVLEQPISAEVVALARRLPPPVLRSLDAIHLASAVLLDVDRIVTYDERLIDAAQRHGIATLAPA